MRNFLDTVGSPKISLTKPNHTCRRWSCKQHCQSNVFSYVTYMTRPDNMFDNKINTKVFHPCENVPLLKNCKWIWGKSLRTLTAPLNPLTTSTHRVLTAVRVVRWVTPWPANHKAHPVDLSRCKCVFPTADLISLEGVNTAFDLGQPRVHPCFPTDFPTRVQVTFATVSGRISSQKSEGSDIYCLCALTRKIVWTDWEATLNPFFCSTELLFTFSFISSNILLDNQTPQFSSKKMN